MEKFSVMKNQKEPLLNHTVLTEASGDRMYATSITFYEKSENYLQKENELTQKILSWRYMFDKFKDESNDDENDSQRKRVKTNKLQTKQELEEILSPTTISSYSTFNFKEENANAFKDFGKKKKILISKI